MKLVQLLFLMSVFAFTSNAQIIKEPQLTKEQKWQIEQTQAFFKQKGEDAATTAFLGTFRKVVASNILCKKVVTPTKAITVNGDRLNTEIAVLTLDVINAKKDETYVIERRFNTPVGRYDSVGVIKANLAGADLNSYRFTDNNDYSGKTWYRIRMAGSNEEKKLVCIEGYENTVTVFPNPATSSALSVQLQRFKTDDNTTVTLLDAAGRPVYTQAKAFANNTTLLRLQKPKLSPGTYYLRVANKFNTGSTSFVVQ